MGGYGGEWVHNRAALDASVTALRSAGRLSETDEALVVFARTLADALDERVSAGVAGEYRLVLEMLGKVEAAEGDDATVSFLEAVRSPVGDTSDAGA